MSIIIRANLPFYSNKYIRELRLYQGIGQGKMPSFRARLSVYLANLAAGPAFRPKGSKEGCPIGHLSLSINHVFLIQMDLGSIPPKHLTGLRFNLDIRATFGRGRDPRPLPRRPGKPAPS